ncbi:hypothetical protein EDC65_1064 [Stella humosa]|uniref:Uncharacterized protein n=2 Tax=Stella humosa TaxID=94 RepID=A0A3N1MGJ1_9PROT|nr:hypothetical protein EDC65_1064 [Stella humosa]
MRSPAAGPYAGVGGVAGSMQSGAVALEWLMVRRLAVASLVAVAPILVAKVAAADMLIQINNQSREQVGLAVSGTGVTHHVLPGGSHSAGPYAETRVVEVTVSDIQLTASGNGLACAGTAVLTALPPNASSCTWVEAAASANAPAKCTVATSGNSSAQCKVMILMAPKD